MCHSLKWVRYGARNGSGDQYLELDLSSEDEISAELVPAEQAPAEVEPVEWTVWRDQREWGSF